MNKSTARIDDPVVAICINGSYSDVQTGATYTNVRGELGGLVETVLIKHAMRLRCITGRFWKFMRYIAGFRLALRKIHLALLRAAPSLLVE